MQWIAIGISALTLLFTVATVVYYAGKQNGRIDEISNNQKADRKRIDDQEKKDDEIKNRLQTMEVAAATNSEMVKTLFKKSEEQQKKIAVLEEKQSVTSEILAKWGATLEHIDKNISEIKEWINSTKSRQPS